MGKKTTTPSYGLEQGGLKFGSYDELNTFYDKNKGNPYITDPRTTTPTPTGTGSSTTGTESSGTGSYLPTTDYTNQSQSDYLADYAKNTELSRAEEQAIRDASMGRYQGEIDAAKSAYARLLAEQQQLGLGRLGESTAVQARRGLIGSSFGTGMTEDVRGVNLKAEDVVLQGRAAAIANIMDRANTAAQNEINAKRAAKSGGYSSYMDYQSKLPEKKKVYIGDIVSGLLNAGLDYNSLSESDLTQLKGLGINQQDIINAYLNKKAEQDAEEAKAAREGRFSLSEGGAMYDAQGNIIASRGKTPTEGERTASLTKDFSQLLQSEQGSDNRVSPDSYKKYKKSWVENGGQAETFDKNFVIYADPTHLKDYGVNADIMGQISASNKTGEQALIEALLAK